MFKAGSSVLLITRNFPPLRGGMERLNQRMLSGLAVHGPVALAGPDGSRQFAPSLAEVKEAPSSPLWRFLPGALIGALRIAIRHRPGIVLAGSGLTAPLAWLVARATGARCAVYLHGLDLVVRDSFYQLLWLPFIRRCDVAIANSSNTQRLAIERGVGADRLHVVNPGTDLPVSHDPAAGRDFRARHGFHRRPLLLSVGRMTPRKGLAEFVRDVMPTVLRSAPDTVLVVIGTDATDALTTRSRSPSERERILGMARQAGVEHAMVLLPPCDDATLSAAYFAADVHVFPVLDLPGDVEGFGMVAIEAAAHGLPTVAYAAGGVPDAIGEGVSGSLVSPGDTRGFADAIGRWLRMDLAAQQDCQRFAARFAWPRFDAGIMAALGREAKVA